MTSKRPKMTTPTDADLKRNPGIGQSKGTAMGDFDPDLIEGESTVEGDVENDVNPSGAADPGQRGRGNRYKPRRQLPPQGHASV